MILGIIQLVILFVAIGIDVWVNWHMIYKEGIRPNHYVNWLIRAAVGAAITYDPYWVPWVLHSINAMFIYWFFFDYSLNLVRHKPLMYLGDSVLDRWQKKVGEFPMFVWKAIIALFCLFNIIINYNT